MKHGAHLQLMRLREVQKTNTRALAIDLTCWAYHPQGTSQRLCGCSPTGRNVQSAIRFSMRFTTSSCGGEAPRARWAASVTSKHVS